MYNKLPENHLWYLESEYSEIVLEKIIDEINSYERYYSIKPCVYCGHISLVHVVNNIGFRYNTNYSERIGLINSKYEVYSERFLNKDEYFICSEDELLLHKRKLKVNKILNKILNRNVI